jgi:hypothetical protein
MTEFNITAFDPINTALENISTDIISITPSTSTLKVSNINLNNGNLSNLGSIEGNIITNKSIKVSDSPKVGFTGPGVDFINDEGDFVDDSISFYFDANASYGSMEKILTSSDSTKIACNNYSFNNLKNNAQFLITFSPYSEFTFNKNSANFYDDTNLINNEIYFNFSENSFVVGAQDVAVISIAKINSKIYFSIQNYYKK